MNPMESIKRSLLEDFNCRNIQNLSVRVETTQIILEGNSKTYFAKQMAQTIAMRFKDGRQIINYIQVD